MVCGMVQTASQALPYTACVGYFSTADALGGSAWLPAILLFKAQGPRQVAEAGHNPYGERAADTCTESSRVNTQLEQICAPGLPPPCLLSASSEPAEAIVNYSSGLSAGLQSVRSILIVL